jgi:hypothetical protein
VSTVKLSVAQAVSPPPNGDHRGNGSTTETKVLGESQTAPNTNVLGVQYEAGTNVLGSGGGILPKTGAPFDFPAAAAGATGMIAAGTAMSRIGRRRLRRFAPAEPAEPSEASPNS